MKQKLNNLTKVLLKYLLFIVIVSVISITCWEQVDDRIESKFNKLGSAEYVRPEQELSPEEQRMKEIKESKDAITVLDAYAKSVYAEELKKKSDQLFKEARASTTSF